MGWAHSQLYKGNAKGRTSAQGVKLRLLTNVCDADRDSGR
jgi:hypothetical protein